MKNIQERIDSILTGPAIPDKEYVVSSPGYTYSYVYSIAAGFKRRFSRIDLRDMPVCICTEDKGIIMAAVLASLAGGPVLILPYSLSEKALAETHEAMQFTYAITDGSAVLPKGVVEISPEKGSWEEVPAGASREIHSVFLMLFTGGSTDKPKVWSKTPINMVNESDFLRERYRVDSRDLIASTVPPYHIYGLLYSILVPFLGSSSVMGKVYIFPQEIIAVLKDRPVTILVSVPVHYRILNGTEIDGSHLRLAFSSAGPLDRDDGIYFHKRSGIGVEEIYGSTETGGIACKCTALGREMLEPFDWVSCTIKSERLCVKSSLISPDLPVDDEGFFVTGDRAEFTGKGYFRLLGRADGVVKVGGKRVDINDVLDKIKQLPGIDDAYVISLKGRKGRDVDLAAMVETSLAEAELKQVLSEKLEPFAVPRRVRIVNKIPTTSTGKYDREAITAIFLGDTEGGGSR
jgi:acyl-coenzyme A synthetase/AMP-(fatty) acid ligase